MPRRLAVWMCVLLEAAPGCLLRLDADISCGDGFVDEGAGEECDPAVPASFEDACAGTSHPMGTADCDPRSCTVVKTAEQCAICGDGIVDGSLGEQCDGDSLDGQACPGGNGALQCSSDCRFDLSECDACGNGMLDAGEECDHGASNDFAVARECAGTADTEPLASPNPDKPFTSGQTLACRPDCRFDRAGCGFCGDGTRDDAVPLQDGVTVPPEWCDGNSFDEERLRGEYGPLCTDPITERPNVACGSDCRSFVELSGGCCLRRNASCPPPSTPATEASGLRCCHELAFPDEDACYASVEADGSIRTLCR